ncbi:protein fantom isoform X2 [Sinocyclocheilus grahami]|uniref:protein fantom isoform X2 n=1 Tax=Sinocyclocheilus grahami TaxID=75366 RepID=UPI0007ACDDCA|nr:PREDICTED: protein fantom-like isoform X2 [Sinocyclocheilus grahami]
MSLAMDETAGDLPVRDVGLRAGLITVLTDFISDTDQDTRNWRRPPQVLKIKDRQRLYRIPREQLEDQCLRIQEENTLLKQHSRTQEQKLRRLSTKLLRLKQGPLTAGRDGELEDTIQELEARVATLESQKRALQSKLSLAKQHILDLGVRTHYRPRTGRGVDGDGGVRRAAQTAPARYGISSQEDTRGEIDRFRSTITENQQGRVAELELSAQSLRETLRDKEKEIEGIVKDLRKQQADGHRLIIKDNVDVIRLQKQLSEKSTSLLVLQEKFAALQEAYENQLEEGQRSLKESQGALLGKVEELSELLKQEKQRVLTLEGQLNAATLSLQALGELQERVSDLEGERNLLKNSYDSLLECTMSVQNHQEGQHEKKDKRSEQFKEESWREDVQRLEERLEEERKEKKMLEQEKEQMRQENGQVQKEKARDRDMVMFLREKHDCLEREVLQHRQEVTSLQEKLDSVTKEFDMSVEDLSETLLQIKAFRMQRETQGMMCFLKTDEKIEETSKDLTAIQASHAETVLELQKTRALLLLQHRLNADLQNEMKTVMEKFEREREENRRRAGEKDKLLKSRSLQISNLQAQLKDIAYSPRNYKQTIPLQYTWTGLEQESVKPAAEDAIITQLREGESLLEIHLTGATFTPLGLRLMGQGTGDHQGVATFCTYGFLDFETLSTSLISGGQPNYGFTSHYALSEFDLEKLRVQDGSITIELHQALGGVQFMTRGRARISLMGAQQRRGERMKNRTNITGAEGEVIGILEFWVCLHPQVELTEPQMERATSRIVIRHTRGSEWAHGEPEEIYDYGVGIPNELEVVLERCVGLSTRWPGLLPDAYLTYRLYDLPPHSTPIIQCCVDPVFEDSASYPLAVTTDLLEYLNVGSLWVYVFDDSERQTPPTYLAKTPIPLRGLAAGRPIRGDYVLRDPAGSPRGMVRATLRWKYPFQSPEAPSRQREGVEKERMVPNAEVSQRPIAKPRSQLRPPPEHGPKTTDTHPSTPIRSPQRGSITLPSPSIQVTEPTSYHQKPQSSLAQPSRSVRRKQHRTAALHVQDKLKPTTAPYLSPAMSIKSHKSNRVMDFRPSASLPSTPRSQRSYRTDSTQQIKMEEEQEYEDQEDETEDRTQNDTDALQSDESRDSNGSDVIIIPHPPKPHKQGDRLRVEILSLSFNRSSSVALDQSVHQVYVEYRLLGIPMETTETPMSLRKPTDGEDIHYNFTRVIHVDSMEAAPLRHYLYTMLEGSDPNQGRLKFTVVSEPMNEQEECEDVGYAYLDLRELLLTGNDFIEEQIDVVSADEDQDVVGKLKVSVEAAQALNGIYQEYHQIVKREKGEPRNSTENEEEESGIQKTELHVLDFEVDEDSDFY